jgi:N-acetyl-anhydromuramyl-L-alanine amidase AmpD
MRLSDEFSSPNFAAEEIPVEFAILHYTAGDLRRTMDFFTDANRKVCAHFVLDTDGCVYDLGHFWNGPIRQGAHAGVSRYLIDGQELTAFNKMSVGIEIINLNGNLFEYTDAQYESLHEILKHFLARFPLLRRPGRILGHEHIAGFRGKCDPGIKFDWRRVLTGLGLKMDARYNQYVFTSDDLAFAQKRMSECARPDELFWSRLSSDLEERIKERFQSRP